MDYLFRWLGLKFPDQDEAADADMAVATAGATSGAPAAESPVTDTQAATLEEAEKAIFQAQADAPPCHACGSSMVRNGSCYRCLNCGETSGCS